uniref:Phosphotransferase n=1 Tax=Phenylobacterium glaciei TaxID=2803784 RepID=A0A974P6K3_9CAUL|nr:phosphotransferase [Phenylobacterium glaciei]
MDGATALSIWEQALAAECSNPPVWLHGDVAAGNLLVKDGRLSAVIDFGILGVGDPACDLAIAWTLLHGPARAAFREALPLDEGTWARGRGWTIWKALIVAAGLSGSDDEERTKSRAIIADLVGSTGNAPTTVILGLVPRIHDLRLSAEVAASPPRANRSTVSMDPRDKPEDDGQWVGVS